MALSTLTSKGQLTVPKTIREYLQIDSGDKIEFIIDEVGHVIISPKTLKIENIYGIIKRKKGITVEDMNNSIKLYVSLKEKKKHDDSN